MRKMTIDGNTAACYVSYAFSELAVVYPITPSSPMAELAEEWSAQGKKNMFGVVPKVVQMQSEGGAAGALHGTLTCGSLATTYTCSQGLLLMLPNMYKMAGELLPTVFHVSARAIATHALSIFGDHQDVMACRQTGFALLAASSVQECMDLAVVAHLAALKSSLPFLHFFDGFRTSHEINKIDALDYEEIHSLLDMQTVETFRKRALTPDAPMQRGTAQNGDVYFQNREAANAYYLRLPKIVQETMDEVAKITKRAYHVFDYVGDEQAERVVVMMGSGCSTMEETIEKMNEQNEQVGLIKVRLYRPFDSEAFCTVLPKSCKKIVVLDRTKEPGCLGEPLYLDVRCALAEKGLSGIEIVGGRYGLGSKEFTPSMCYAVFRNLQKEHPKPRFTVGIIDDVTHTSLDCSIPYHPNADYVACKFYGLGSDGTVGANKNSIKIIGEHTPYYAQGYFYYDSKKSGGVTISHLRFGQNPIRAAYLIDRADFVACHNPSYLMKYDMLSDLKENGIFLLNCPCESEEELNAYLPPSFKEILIQKNISVHFINATKIANDVGLSGRTSTIMQAAFFLLNPGLLPYTQAKKYLEDDLRKTFAKKGEDVIRKNVLALEEVENALKPAKLALTNNPSTQPACDGKESGYLHDFIQPILSLRGDSLPVSAFSADGSVPTGTAAKEKRALPYLLPMWIMENCIQCCQCSFVCPHACIRPFVRDNKVPSPAFPEKPAVGLQEKSFSIQIDPHHCMGCGVCANVCPAKEKALVMRVATEIVEQTQKKWGFAKTFPVMEVPEFKRNTVKGSQFSPPLFEFSYACAGCGETAYIKLLTQLFGEKMIIANATGCSSIYGGSAPICPYTTNSEGKGPAWANSLFEDNAEFGLGMRLAYDTRDTENKKSVWIIGGDGWAYDIGYGGLDHVLASGANVNILVLDSEVYSNTGGQVSKATPMGAVARFAAGGKRKQKKRLALMAMAYKNVYVAQVCIGANKQQYLNALTEAESFDGPSLVIAYTPCIAHGVPMNKSVEEEKFAVDCGYWHLFRYDPRRKTEGNPPFVLDSKEPTASFQDFLAGENRFAVLKNSRPEIAEKLFIQAEQESKELFDFYQKLSTIL